MYCHEVGTPQAQDVLVLEFPSEPTWMASVDVTDDGKFIVAGISRSCEPVGSQLQMPLEAGASLKP